MQTNGKHHSPTSPKSETVAPWQDKTVLTDAEFEKLSAFIYKQIGISMSSVKKTMLQARLQKRLRQLDMTSFKTYCDYLFSSEGMRDELGPLINVVTTNKTDFFREPHHFEFLAQIAIPQFTRDGSLFHRPFRVWSSACSSGEEPYTLAMVLSEYQEHYGDFSWSVLGTDISTRVLDKAVTGVYPEEEITPVPHHMRSKYLLRSKNRDKRLVKISSTLQNKVSFKHLNLMDPEYGIKGLFEAIFCRNVIIYFDKKTQETLIKKLYRYLVPGGYIFFGHAESINGIDLPLEPVATTVYRKPLE